MSKPTLMTKTPDAAEVNNLIELHGEILDNPEQERIAIVRIKTVSVVHDVAAGEDQAKVALRQIEVLQSPADIEAARKLMLKAFRVRTNNSSLPDLDEAKATPDTPLEGLGDDVDDSVE
jgi:hypothetical protein